MMKKIRNEIETQAKIIVQGIPYDRYSSFKRGSAKAPDKIRQALTNGSANLWSESGINIGDDNATFDAGDLNSSPETDVFEEIQLSVSKIYENGKKPLSLPETPPYV